MKGFWGCALRVVALFVLLACASAWAQQLHTVPQAPRTKLEAFEKQVGAVLVRGVSVIGQVSCGFETVSVSCMEFVNVSTWMRETGIWIFVSEKGGAKEGSFIDYDEIGPLVEGIDRISRLASAPANAPTKLAKFESIYKTQGGFSVRRFTNPKGEFVTSITSGSIETATAYVSLEQLNDVSGLILQAKQTLDSITKQMLEGTK
jgi:hypothetical protein